MVLNTVKYGLRVELATSHLLHVLRISCISKSQTISSFIEFARIKLLELVLSFTNSKLIFLFADLFEMFDRVFRCA